MTDIPLSATEWLRVSLLYAHLLASMLAIARVLSADVGIVTGRLGRQALHGSARDITRLLVALWVTGLAIVWLDTGFDAASIAERPKLLLKLVGVSVLTANGVLLHRLSFPLMLSRTPPGTRASLVLAVTGALSTFHWLLAAFVGVSKPLGRLPLEVLLGGYVVGCASALLAAIACVAFVRRRVLHWRAVDGTDVASERAYC